jgi:hypothetical protein
MAQVVSVVVAGSNGNAYTSTRTMGFPTQGIVVSPMTATTYGATSCVTQIKVLATSEVFYSGTATATVITACNA